MFLTKVLIYSLLLKLLNVFWNLLENAKDFTDLAEHDLAGSYNRHKNIFNALQESDYEHLYELIEDHYKFTKERVSNWFLDTLKDTYLYT